MIFGLATVIGGIGQATPKDLFAPVAGLLVGGAWFAFGKYGGLPLVNTVADWHPSAPGALEDMHRRGLLVMRARRWTLWAAMPGALIVTVFLVPSLLERGHPELVVLVLGMSLGYINCRYVLEPVSKVRLRLLYQIDESGCPSPKGQRLRALWSLARRLQK